LAAATALQAQELVTNGGFETGDFTGWTPAGSPAINSTTPISGLYSADLSGGSDAIEWGLTVPAFSPGLGLVWNFDFSTTETTVAAGNGERFRLMSASGAMITLRITDTGLEAFDSSSAWYNANSLALSANTTYSVRVTVDEMGGTPGTDFTVDVSTDGGSSYTLGGINYGTAAFQGGRDWDAGLSPDGVRYEDPASGTLTIDNVSVVLVPEPATFALAGLGIAGLLIWRRRA